MLNHQCTEAIIIIITSLTLS